MKGGSKVVVQPHRHDGVFVAKGKEDALCTKNLVPGEAVYGEKRVSVQVIHTDLEMICLMIVANFSGFLFLCKDPFLFCDYF